MDLNCGHVLKVKAAIANAAHGAGKAARAYGNLKTSMPDVGNDTWALSLSAGASWTWRA